MNKLKIFWSVIGIIELTSLFIARMCFYAELTEAQFFIKFWPLSVACLATGICAALVKE